MSNSDEEVDKLKRDSLNHSGTSIRSNSRLAGVKTYVVSVPHDSITPKIKYGSLKQINLGDNLQDIEKAIEEVEQKTVEIINNINNINIECSKCGRKLWRYLSESQKNKLFQKVSD